MVIHVEWNHNPEKFCGKEGRRCTGTLMHIEHGGKVSARDSVDAMSVPL